MTVILEALDDTDAEIRFLGCFAVSAIKIEAALPRLNILAQTDNAIVEGWWSVGEEAADAITSINGGDPPLRQPSPSPSPKPVISIRSGEAVILASPAPTYNKG